LSNAVDIYKNKRNGKRYFQRDDGIEIYLNTFKVLHLRDYIYNIKKLATKIYWNSGKLISIIKELKLKIFLPEMILHENLMDKK